PSLLSVSCQLFPCFSYHSYPPHLHSFPTRRSSDLARAVGKPVRCVSWPSRTPKPRPRRVHNRCCRRQRPGTRSCAITCHLRRPRSEEHTSEVQSRVELVCRLLLEKKKTYFS